MFDPQSFGTGNQLAQWECFRLAQGLGSSNLETTTVLKYWSFILSPQGGPTGINFKTTGGPLPVVENSVSAASTPSAPLTNYNYTQDHRSQKTIMYSHNCMNAHVKFADQNGTTPLNVQYYLIALAPGTDPTKGFRLNAVIKTNFVDS